MFFIGRPDVRQGDHFELGDGSAVSAPILRDAFFLAACEFGEDCGPDNVYVSARCVNMGYCELPNVEAMLRYTYSPADVQRLMAARQVILTGIQTGQWPSNFWNPPKR
jgi:hypothetical protein